MLSSIIPSNKKKDTLLWELKKLFSENDFLPSSVLYSCESLSDEDLGMYLNYMVQIVDRVDKMSDTEKLEFFKTLNAYTKSAQTIAINFLNKKERQKEEQKRKQEMENASKVLDQDFI